MRIIHVSEPYDCQAARQAVAGEMEHGWISSHGPRVAEFEAALATAMGCTYVVATSSCTAAIEACAAYASQGAPLTEFKLPAVTFASVRNAVARHGFVDYYEAACVNQPQVIYANDSEVCVDAAHVCRPMMLGRDTSCPWCLSFYPTKVMSGIEGGAICTEDAELAKWTRIYTRNGLSRVGSEWSYIDTGDGIKAAMTNLAAAYLLAQLPFLEQINDTRDKLARAYRNKLARWEADCTAGGNYVFCLDLQENARRERVRSALAEAGVETTVAFRSLHPEILTDWYENTLILPLHPQLTPEQVAEICGIVKENV